jgi:sugar/nucleoside kinase (ribokinase family)
MPLRLPLLAAEKLQGARNVLVRSKVLVGLDGFVDTILHVVDKRESATQFTRITKMGEFGKRVGAAAGRSANFEMVAEMVKLGGNGPIMANALGAAGFPVTYIGNLGKPAIHPVFADFAKRAEVISLAEPGYTDAVEFDDGKLMFGKHESLREVTWANLLKHCPEAVFRKKLGEASLVALVNWTMLPHMTAIFRKVLAASAPSKAAKRPWVFFDLADPAKRTAADIFEALGVISKFQKSFRTVLGLNFSESRQIGSVLGLKNSGEDQAAVAAHSARIREKLRIDTVVIHPTAFAAAADEAGTAFVDGPYTPRPKITTGAGDHFNAGFCLGRVLGTDLATSLQYGVATSGYYVRHAKSPRLEDLKRFLQTL